MFVVGAVGHLVDLYIFFLLNLQPSKELVGPMWRLPSKIGWFEPSQNVEFAWCPFCLRQDIISTISQLQKRALAL